MGVLEESITSRVLSFFNFHCFNNIKSDMNSKSDKNSNRSDKSVSPKHKRAEEKEMIPVASLEKGSNKTGYELGS